MYSDELARKFTADDLVACVIVAGLLIAWLIISVI